MEKLLLMEWTFVGFPLITFEIFCVSLELPHVLTHVVSTVHGTCRLLVAWKVYAHHHFFFSIWGMNSSFVNVVLVSPIFL